MRDAFCLQSTSSRAELTLKTQTNHCHFRCKVPGIQSDTFATSSDSESQVVDRYIPRGRNGRYRKCQIMSGLNDTELATDVYSKRGVAGNLSSCMEWVYDQSVMKRTLVSEVSRKYIGYNYSCHWLSQDIIIILSNCPFRSEVYHSFRYITINNHQKLCVVINALRIMGVVTQQRDKTVLRALLVFLIWLPTRV